MAQAMLEKAHPDEHLWSKCAFAIAEARARDPQGLLSWRGPLAELLFAPLAPASCALNTTSMHSSCDSSPAPDRGRALVATTPVLSCSTAAPPRHGAVATASTTSPSTSRPRHAIATAAATPSTSRHALPTATTAPSRTVPSTIRHDGAGATTAPSTRHAPVVAATAPSAIAPSTKQYAPSTNTAAPSPIEYSSKSYREKVEASKRKLHMGYERAVAAKKQHTIRMLRPNQVMPLSPPSCKKGMHHQLQRHGGVQFRAH